MVKYAEIKKVRLQKFLSECGVASRRSAEVLITEGKVRVNEKIVTELGTSVDPLRDVVRVRNKTVRPAEKGIALFHKPREVISTLSDPEGRKCLADYLTKHYQSYFPVGRLDWESSGLVILTNDGELAEKLLHPRYGLPRVYDVRVSGRVHDRDLIRMERGVMLDDGPARAAATILSMDHDSTWLRLSITEGRNRIIRRLMKQLHHPVLKLQRISHGPFKLGKIRPGDIKPLSLDEYEKAKREVFRALEKSKTKPDEVVSRTTPKAATPEKRSFSSSTNRPKRPYGKPNRAPKGKPRRR